MIMQMADNDVRTWFWGKKTRLWTKQVSILNLRSLEGILTHQYREGRPRHAQIVGTLDMVVRNRNEKALYIIQQVMLKVKKDRTLCLVL